MRFYFPLVLTSFCYIEVTWSFINLSSVQWSVLNANKSISLNATVPGGIYSDLMHAGILQEDILYNFNDINYRWVGSDNWTYFTQFQVQEEVLSYQNVFLVFHGIDTIAEVYLNGHHIGSCSNMFVRYKFNIKPFIQVEFNLLEVRFTSAITSAKELARSLTYPIPPHCVPADYNGECHVNLLRKMQASFAWDWGPAFPSCGIWKDVMLETYNRVILRDVTFKLYSQGKFWLVNTMLYLETAQPMYGFVKAELKTDSNVYSSSQTVYLGPHLGETNATLTITVPKNAVKSWWPNGYGSQHLYKLSATVTAGGETSSKTVRVGFRTVKLIQKPVSPHDFKKGLSFFFLINGVPVFMKGSNWIPAHILPEIGSKKETVQHLLQSSVLANMNMIRVWGGGVYESEIFYKLCDELGLLIWQDMMFACGLYPSEENFLTNVAVETRQQVLRLQHHPSIVIWAGNNENEGALRQNWYGTWSNFSGYKADYVKLYIDTIGRIVKLHDSSRPFIASSPTNGLGSEMEGYVAEDPQSHIYGDTHTYEYMADGWNWLVYPKTRFSSEYGIQSLPSLASLATACLPADLHLNSEFLNSRLHHSGGYMKIEIEIEYHMPFSSNLSVYIYLSQINQAMSMKVETEFYRRERSFLYSTGEGFTMGALYWQLNDVWLAPSWSSIEYGGKWKMLHYFARNFFSPVLISSVITADEKLDIRLVSDLQYNIPLVTLTVLLYGWQSFTPLRSHSLHHHLLGGVSEQVFEHDLMNLLAGTPCNSTAECFFYFTLSSDQAPVAPDNFLFLGPLTSQSRGSPTILISKVTQEDKGNKFRIEVSSDRIALFVWLESDIQGKFSENGFIMIQETQDVYFTSEQHYSSKQVKKSLHVTALMKRYE